MIKAFKHSDKLPEGLKARLFKKRFISAPSVTVSKAFDPEKEMIIEGIANAAQADRCNEIIDADAWDLDNYKNNSIILVQHDQNRRVGTCIEFSADKDGLHCRALIGDPTKAPLTRLQINTRSEIAQGILKAFSVGFLPRAIEYDEEAETLRYTDVELLEISLVSIPMQQDSLVTSVKSFEGTVMSDTSTKGSPDQSEPSAMLKEIKDMIEDHAKCSKDMYKSVKDLHKKIDDMAPKKGAADDQDPDGDDDMKALREQNRDLKSQVKELVESSELLMSELRKQGILKQVEGK